MNPLAQFLIFFSIITLAHSKNISTVVPLKAALYGTNFDAQIRFGNQSFWVLVDTGSSDTWVLGESWQCVADNLTTVLPRAACDFGNATYHPSPTFQSIAGEWLGDHYGVGDSFGSLGYEDIRIGAIEIPRQEIGVVNKSSNPGDGFNSGFVGFGHPSISAIHPDSYGENNTLLGDRILYPTIFTRLVQEGMEPYISLALERTPLDDEYGFGGYLGLGTLPPVEYGTFTTVPVELTKTIPAAALNGTEKISEWTLTVQSVSYGNGTSRYSTPFQAVIDSGNWLNVVPPALAREVNKQFQPPAVPMPGACQGAYGVSCNATPPSFAVEIGGRSFAVDARDMIWRNAAGSCFSSVAPGAAVDGIDLLFLGDAFLKNVLAVFDIGKEQMRFAPRQGNGTAASAPQTGSARSLGLGSAIGVLGFVTCVVSLVM